MKYLFLLLSLGVSALTATALDVTTSAAGEVEALLGDNTATTTLAITGPVNATDLHFISGLKDLSTLDLSKATIVAETNGRLATNVSQYKADALPPYILAGSSFSTIYLPAGLTEIEAGALMSTPIKAITIPASVKSIGTGAFADCKELTRLVIPATVTTTGSHLCDGATALTRVTYQATSIPAYAFRGCTALTEVEGTPTSIGDYAFAGCTSLSDFSFAPATTAIGTGAFYNSGLTAAALDGCTRLASIGDYAFAKCGDLTAVSLPTSLGSMGQGAFFDDKALRSLSLPDGMKALPDFALKGTESLNSGTLLNEGLESIGRFAMAGMTSMSALNLPSTLETIDGNAMENMTGLNHINARALDHVPALGEEVWAGVDQPAVMLYVNDATEDAFLAAPQWNEFVISTSGINPGPTTDVDNPEVSLTFSLNTDALEIRSSAPVKQALIYDTAGHILIRSTPDTTPTMLALPLDGITPQVLIVTVTTSHAGGDSVSTFKIAR